MTTKVIITTNEPVQITTGANSALISTPTGEFINFAGSDVKPVDLSQCDTLTGRLVVTPPMKIWIWSIGVNVRVSITEW